MVDSGTLQASHWGASVLVDIAKRRRSGTLTTGAGSTPLVFVAGRPEALKASASILREKPHVVARLRTIAGENSGSFEFQEETHTFSPSLGIDTLGEVLMAIASDMPWPKVQAYVQAHANATVTPTGLFEKLATALAGLGLPKISAPKSPTPLSALTSDGQASARAWSAMLTMGGATVAQTAAAAAPIPADVAAMHKRLETQSHYEFLGVAENVGADDIRKAYIALAKRWHVDGFPNVGEPTRKMVEEIFGRLNEAQRVLCDPKERDAYNFVQKRKAEGLPTEAGAILEAESLFRKAQALVRRGQAQAALPLLEQAVEMNKGEAEFWVYLGFALYHSRGSEALDQAIAHIQKGKKMRDNLDAAEEFMGRIFRVEGRFDEAQKHLRAALEMNKNNQEAQRELRYLSMRQSKGSKGPSSMKDLFRRWFAR